MKLYKVILPLVFMTVLSLHGLSAQEKLTLTLEECQSIASHNSSTVLNASLDVSAAKARRQEALAEYFPRVSASAFGYWAMNPMLEIGIIDILGNNDFAWNVKDKLDSYGEQYGINTNYSAFKQGYSASLMALQPLYAGGRIVNGNRLALLGVEAACLQREMSLRSSREEVSSLWWQVVSLEDKLEVLDYLDTTLDTLYVSLRSAIDSGLAGQTEILQIEHKRGELRSSRKKAVSGLRLMKMNLLNTIGQDFALTSATSSPERPYIDDIVLDAHQEAPREPDFYWRDEQEILSGMSETHLLELQVKARKLERSMAVGEALPQLAVGATTSYSNLYDKGHCNVIAFASLQIPLSDWGKTAKKTQRLDAQVGKAENDRSFLERQLRLKIAKAWLDLTSAYDQWQLSEDALDKSTRLYEVSLQNYSAGLISLQELLQAETICRSDASQRIDALIEYRTAILAYTGL